MSVFPLRQEPVFPSPALAGEDGLLAVGGDLSPERLLTAYAQGIFPWYSENMPILWWSPDPRLILEPGRLHVLARLERILRRVGTCRRPGLRMGRGSGLHHRMGMFSEYQGKMPCA